MNIHKAHAAYRSAVFVFYLWLGAFVIPIVFPVVFPTTDSLVGISLILIPAVLGGFWISPRVIKSGVISDIAVFVIVPICLSIFGLYLRLIGA